MTTPVPTRNHLRTTALAASMCAALSAFGPAPVAAQYVASACGIAPGITAAAGYVSYPPGGGITGATAGVDVAFDYAAYAFRVGYRHALLDGEAADPDIVRGRVAYFVGEMPDGVSLCVTGHVGLNRFSFQDDAGVVVAGGVGGRLVRTGGGLRPFVELRGLAARTAGNVLGLTVNAAGLSLGVEAGATLDLDPLAVRLTGTLDGFDDGLGVTPYPGRSVELALEYRF